MNKALALGLLAVGILLIILGVNATNSFSSDVSRFFTGSPTDKSIWLLIGGIIAAVAGLVGLARSGRSGVS
jgi:hypothetical protein